VNSNDFSFRLKDVHAADLYVAYSTHAQIEQNP